MDATSTDSLVVDRVHCGPPESGNGGWTSGELAAYLESLERIAALTGNGSVTTILPGHGPTVPDAGAMVAYYRTHRAERLEQVRQALADGAALDSDPVDGVLERVYADVPREVWPAARMSIRAQLTYLGVSGRGA